MTAKAKRINSRQKGARGEREFRDLLRAEGYSARRGQQFSGANGDPDVVCPCLPWAHWEVKCVERYDLPAWLQQAKDDAAKTGRVPIVAHTRNWEGWNISMPWEYFVELLRGDHLDDDYRGKTSPETKPEPPVGEIPPSARY